MTEITTPLPRKSGDTSAAWPRPVRCFPSLVAFHPRARDALL